MAFECSECGFSNNEIQSATEISRTGCRITLRVEKPIDLNRRVVRTKECIASIPELDLTIQPTTSSLTTVEGVLEKARIELSNGQASRLEVDYDSWKGVQDVLDSLKSLQALEQSFTLILDDPTGNSFVENPSAPSCDVGCLVEHYSRTREQDEALGMFESNSITKMAESDVAESNLVEKEPPEEFTEERDVQNDIHTFKTPCSRCSVETETRMHMLDIPHFKQVIVMSTVCEACGYKSNEVKAGGAISEKGRKITLKLTSPLDLSRDILKSETCGLTIPEIDLTLQPGTLGGRFTTIEGLLRQVYQEIDEKAAFRQGDSVDPARKVAFDSFLVKLNQVVEMKDGDCYTLELDDPMANSFLQNLYAPDVDPEMSIVDYDRTWEQNEEWGLNDIKTEGYE